MAGLHVRLLAPALILFLPAAVGAAEPPPSAEAVLFFEKKIRPLLVEQCQNCHGGEKTRGGLKVTSRATLLQGGDTGPALVPGKPEMSRLIEAVCYTGDLKMPPKGKLTPQQIADLTAWVKGGAPWPDAGTGTTVVKSDGPLFSPEQRAFWAFQPMREPALPAVKDSSWPVSPIDNFVLARLEAKGLRPAATADKRTLLRRVTFDLTGLPPTPEEVAAFLADDRPEAFASVVDRLLASPAYGERWGRHWLDVARYADSNGLDENTAFANAYRYRDYVIDAFNKDKPYDQFVVDQLAGDLLPPDTEERVNHDRLVATAFLSLGPKLLAEPDKQKMVMDIVDEQIDVTGKVFLGLTISCARCHDHKFDPIPTRDYYGLAGIFKSTKTMATLNTVARVNERPLSDAKVVEAAARHAALVKAKEKELKAARDEAAKVKLKAELDELKKHAPPPPIMVIAVEDDKPANVKVHLRGNHLTLGVEAPRQFPQILAGEKQTPVTAGSGRLELAHWLTRPDHPLTARVMVNRIWQHHFGEGLVRSPDNFGKLGERPTHPELLDWLALRFVEDGWSIKALHRRILLSRTYQMGSAHNAQAAMADPDNRLLWRFNRNRLEVEAMRDAMLAVSGKLDRTTGGTLLTTPNFGYVTNDQSGNAAQYTSPRRSIYLPVIRNAVFDVFQVFDFVEPSVENGKRDNTVVAPQALFLLNGEFVREQSRAFAISLMSRNDLDDAGRVRQAYVRAFAREPTEIEMKRTLDFLTRYADKLPKEVDASKRRQTAWQAFCQVLFAANEFMYLN